jgi:hypothetical protein
LMLCMVSAAWGYTKGKKGEIEKSKTETPSQKVQKEIIATGGVEVGAERKGPRIEKVGDTTVRFLDDQGRVKKEMQLRRNSHKRPPPAEWGWGPGAQMQVIDEEHAYAAPNGKYVGIVKANAIAYEEGYEGGAKIELLDEQGSILWEKSDIDIANYPPRFSSDGRYFYGYFFKGFDYESMGKSVVFDVVLKKEIFSFPAKPMVVSPNGFYGVIGDIDRKQTTLFSARTGKTHTEVGYHRVEPLDDGTFRFFREEGTTVRNTRRIYSGKEVKLE